MQINTHTHSESKNPLFIVLNGWTSSCLYRGIGIACESCKTFYVQSFPNRICIRVVNATSWNREAKTRLLAWLLKYINIRGELYELRVGVYDEEIHFMNIHRTKLYRFGCHASTYVFAGTFSSISSFAG